MTSDDRLIKAASRCADIARRYGERAESPASWDLMVAEVEVLAGWLLELALPPGAVEDGLLPPVRRQLIARHGIEAGHRLYDGVAEVLDRAGVTSPDHHAAMPRRARCARPPGAAARRPRRPPHGSSMSDNDGVPRRETESRRPDWTSGTPVRLGDGEWWALPKIELAVLITASGLQDDLAKALELAREAQVERQGSRAEVLRHVQYHMHMANAGLRLLQANYDLPDRDWEALLVFGGIKEMLTFTSEVSATLSEACTRLPLLRSGQESPDFASPN